MVALIAEIAVNCFWSRSDLFNVSHQITGYVSWHNQPPLHITLSKLVFTGNCICFDYIMICQCHQHTPSVSFHLHDPDALAVDFEQVIISNILFTVLFANQIMIYFTSVAHVPLVLSCLLNSSPLAADIKQVIVPFSCFLTCLLTRY